MPFSKEWDSKPKVSVYPFSRNNAVVCHNCYTGWPRQTLNVCTGLCRECVKENPVTIPEVRGSSSRPGKITCRRCPKSIKKNNIGICRDVCYNCRKDNHPLKQRCIGCDQYFKDCWNNVCRRCRFGKWLCERVGYFYPNKERHRNECFCLSHDEQLERDFLQIPPI